MRTKELQIGCSSFQNSLWKNVFYPEKLPRSKWFSYYCEHFKTYELNGTFYKFPTAESLKKWHDSSPDDFVFSVKAPKIITHIRKFENCGNELSEFYAACNDGLRAKLGCVLFQFSPGFNYTKERLDNLISGLNLDFENVVEFRNETWWRNEVYDAFTENHIIFCNVSFPKLPEILVATTETLYFRLHGIPKLFYSEYEQNELDDLYQKIIQNPCAKAFVYFNNTADVGGIKNAVYFKTLE